MVSAAVEVAGILLGAGNPTLLDNNHCYCSFRGSFSRIGRWD